MADVCPRCRRPLRDQVPRPSGDVCWGDTDHECDIAAAAYRRGIDEGVRLAKERARVAVHSATDDGRDVVIARINWTDVDAAAAKAKGET